MLVCYTKAPGHNNANSTPVKTIFPQQLKKYNGCSKVIALLLVELVFVLLLRRLSYRGRTAPRVCGYHKWFVCVVFGKEDTKTKRGRPGRGQKADQKKSPRFVDLFPRAYSPQQW